MQLVAVLTLLALFTHNNLFWIAALLLAFVQLPDFSSPMSSIAKSLEKLAGGREPSTAPTPAMPEPSVEVKPSSTVMPERPSEVPGEGPNNA
jgi:hypothetical protein